MDFKFKRGTTAANAAYTGPSGTISLDTQTNTLRIHDGVTQGGFPLTAATATKLATSRTISLTGDATGSASFDGSANATITVTIANNSHDHTNFVALDGSRTMTGDLKTNGGIQIGSSQQASMVFNATTNSIDFIIN